MTKALDYHAQFPAGKLGLAPTKPMDSVENMRLAYTPGVAEPCIEINKDPENAYKYTSKGNLVAVISNGTAVLGLGDIGALASKPVMEGKAALFKTFAGVDSIDIEIDEKDPQKLIEIIKAIAPTFGGINLEDIKAPECFEIEETLSNALDIPVFHDDQHGTAVIVLAALINACKLQNKSFENLKVVVSGAGAAAVACMNLLIEAGVQKKNFYVFDSKGFIHTGRSDLVPSKKVFAHDKELNLTEALKGADMFLGVSKASLLTNDMIDGMAENPIVFALANPVPEISPEEILRKDVIIATGSSNVNQVNNFICFPYLFRGALDVGAKKITTKMKIACAHALADITQEEVPQEVLDVYGLAELKFGPHYIIPKPFDRRLYYRISAAVAKSAMAEGIAQRPITDFDVYEKELAKRLA